MYDIVVAITRMDLCAEQAHQQVSKYVTDRFDEILFVLAEMGYPDDQLLEIATSHVLLKQHEFYGKRKALDEVNRIVTQLQSDADLIG